MDRAGEKLKRRRDRLKLTYRDVEQASQKIAARHACDEYAIALSRLSDIENKGTVPSIYRIYSLCAIYRLDFEEVLRWYGIPVDQLAGEAVRIGLDQTHLVQFTPGEMAYGKAAPPPASPRGSGSGPGPDINQTTLLSHLARNWGKSAFGFLSGLDLRNYRYGFIGLEDWSMFPILHPGSLVAIDESRRKIAAGGWTTEYERPIYFLEHREGYVCGWCTLLGERLTIQPHPGSSQPAISFAWPSEIDLVGQVTGVAMLLETAKRNRNQTGAVRVTSQNP
jgi:transcriptional regulator with XRE-family HTH domain